MSEYLMSDTLELIEQSTDKYRLKRTLLAIEAGYSEEESGLVIGQCKALIESLCKTILDEKKVEIEPDASISKLAKKAGASLGIGEEHGQNIKTKEAFIKLINSFTNSLENASSSIGTLRNDYCPMAHGRSFEHKPLHMLYARFVVLQTDAFVSFLLNLLEHKKFMEPIINYTENEDFNEFLVENYGELTIYGDNYLASDILFQMNKDKYTVALREFNEGGLND